MKRVILTGCDSSSSLIAVEIPTKQRQLSQIQIITISEAIQQVLHSN